MCYPKSKQRESNAVNDCGTLGIALFKMRWDGRYRRSCGSGAVVTVLAVNHLKNTEYLNDLSINRHHYTATLPNFVTPHFAFKLESCMTDIGIRQAGATPHSIPPAL